MDQTWKTYSFSTSSPQQHLSHLIAGSTFLYFFSTYCDLVHLQESLSHSTHVIPQGVSHCFFGRSCGLRPSGCNLCHSCNWRAVAAQYMAIPSWMILSHLVRNWGHTKYCPNILASYTVQSTTSMTCSCCSYLFVTVQHSVPYSDAVQMMVL